MEDYYNSNSNSVDNSFLKEVSKHHHDILKSLNESSKNFKQLLKELRLPQKVLRRKLLELISSGLVLREEKEDKKEYFLLTQLGLNAWKTYENRVLKYRTPDGKFPRVKLFK
ncbi:MAG: hypothetical protein LBM96_07365 [Methanobrevibacter sp.]|jgi:DNA-binding HxlR family transcriptional regulator|nr:hypothetical protein [Candidatus Methanoflexus mossambicus]